MAAFEQAQVEELLYQALETEQGGIRIYQQAVAAAIDRHLKKEWTEFLEQTRRHEQVLLGVFSELGLDPNMQTIGRRLVLDIGMALEGAIRRAREAGDPSAAQIVAGECVTLAETKDHLNWELIAMLGSKTGGKQARVLQKASSQVEDEEDRHLYHTAGWARELWIRSLGLPAVLPPPEEVKDVETAIGASRAQQARDTMLRNGQQRRAG
jgi:hypothetical protein